MTEKEYNKMYDKLNRLFDGVTPLKKDCGALCSGACCKGDDKTGMLLFPFEKTQLREISENGRRFVVCSGECNRSIRPLSCRIFPFFPTLNEKGKIEIAADKRGYDICPLVRHSEEIIFDRRFLRNVKKAGKILSKDAQCRAFLQEISEQINELNEFINKINI
ncbi:MAG: hypothetical protein J1E34_00610 [Oscillospiraceae bacterium]|nr:hypothetical protein [Oscillospiraceae bacterium]